MEIRFTKEEDLKSIIELFKAHTSYEKITFIEGNKVELLRKQLFNSKEGLKCIVVESVGEIVGYATFIKQFSTWDVDYYIYLDCLFLKESVRGKGIGKDVLEIIKKYAKSVNCSVIQWQTPIFNKRAIQFYSALGAESKSKERFTWKV